MTDVKKFSPSGLRMADTADPLHFVLKDGTLVFLHSPSSKCGGVLHMPAANGENLGSELEDAFDQFLKLAKLHSGVGVEVKILSFGNRKAPGLEKAIAQRAFRVLTQKSVSEVSELYFYGDSGRLRLAPMATASSTKSAEAPRRRKVLIVDDSKTIRDLLMKILQADKDLEVVGQAELPSKVEAMIQTLKPDVMTMDINMPEMSGVDLIAKLLPKYQIPTVMISALSIEDGNEVLQALDLGAVDYIQKPSFSQLTEQAPHIVERVKQASYAKVNVKAKSQAQLVSQPIKKMSAAAAGTHPFPGRLVAIGASTGGTQALTTVLTQLPEQIPPILIVQHIPPVFSEAFAQRLNTLCPFEVREAVDGDVVLPNRVLISPGGKQMSLEVRGADFVVKVDDRPPVNRHKPSVDVLFESVALNAGKRSIGVILTGMGADGAKGLLKMKNARSRTIAQDEATSIVFGMPREAIKIGAVELIKPLDEVAGAIMELLSAKKAA